MSKRNSWTVAIEGRRLLQQCEARTAYHLARKSYWQVRCDAAVAAINAETVRVRETQVTGGTQLTVKTDTEPYQNLSFASSKRKAHDDKLVEYERWHQMLSTNQTYDCDVDDYAFFFDPIPEDQEQAQ